MCALNGGRPLPPFLFLASFSSTDKNQFMPGRRQIVDAIAAVARRLRRAPTRAQFISLSGISLYFVLQSFPKWNDAIRAAGLRPYSLNARIADGALLEDWGKVVRRKRSLLKY